MKAPDPSKPQTLVDKWLAENPDKRKWFETELGIMEAELIEEEPQRLPKRYNSVAEMLAGQLTVDELREWIVTLWDRQHELGQQLEEIEKQPDALTRLESWLAGGPGRSATNAWVPIVGNTGGFGTTLSSNGNRVFSLENGQGDERVAIAKEPGLDATILAAIDRAEELKL